MSYRAHIITQHRDYADAMYFSWDTWSAYFDHLVEQYDEEYLLMVNENEDYYEMEKTLIEKEIERLTDEGLDKPFEFGVTHTNRDAVTWLQRSLKSAPADDSYVSWEWF
jgi:hypothetical protein